MSLIAKYQLECPDSTRLFERFPGLELHVEQVAASGPETLSVALWARPEAQTAFESELEQLDAVESIGYIDHHADRTRCQLSIVASKTTYWDWISLGGVLLDCTVTAEGVAVRMRFPDREALVAYRECCREQGIQFSLTGLSNGDSDFPSGSSTTASQREMVVLAIEHGYFEIPRETSLSELANVFGISDQAASERLRRALTNILGNGAIELQPPTSRKEAFQ